MPRPSSLFPLYSGAGHPALHSFPTRRSSDLPHFLRPEKFLNFLAARDEPTPSTSCRLPLAIELNNVESVGSSRSEEHTSELQSRLHLVCRLLHEKKNIPRIPPSGARHPTPPD